MDPTSWLCSPAVSSSFVADLFGPEMRKTVALFSVLALLIGGGSFFRWLNVERSMRRKDPLHCLDCPGLAIGGGLVAAIMAIFVLVRPS
jgi:putative membrane protein